MSRLAVAGAGAFGTALAVTLARDGRQVTLWARDADHVAEMKSFGYNRRLPGVTLPDGIALTADMADLAGQEAVLLAVPMQALSGVLAAAAPALGRTPLVACCKGIDLASGDGPSAVIGHGCPDALPAVLTGPSFARDIAAGLPTALTLACRDAEAGTALQTLLSTPTLRLYRSTDVTGAELGGALKNVIAIAAGIVIGAGLGESARAALMTRGFAEMQRLARDFDALPETLGGLSGLGDLVLTCTSNQSRNFRYGAALGHSDGFDPSLTVEGVATAQAVAALARDRGIDMPISQAVADVIDGRHTIAEVVDTLLSRPLKEE
ncbi:glycerol-3-phosphate dehydrogenase (NAD(P)+) [Rhodovulum iodosum]|uniref:Glycerol-3-phosphate dehydrogenase [NAD(P)+] n=1 Tax=Rhodovulum iodosum TaxID=68291 RepID=A0ABV3XRJ3_9RHOB|nr:NAD(P)H-dependent glycerol-3-phosphate dehydrogenase [Rhodovulum robiginosum]RSK30291.1 NAD(P)-dependent glycerol-3-phosphate dehydrogenase [Rhodovulum robiginosum]